MNLDYNERLFSGKGLRNWLHNGRFHWIRNTMINMNLGAVSTLELGCFDGRLLQYIPVEPKSYDGFDADWEGGLSRAQERFRGHLSWHFHKTESPEVFKSYADDHFDIAVALETLEHLPPNMVHDYLKEISRVTKKYFLVTVPNELGIVFLAKWIAKKMVYGSAQKYTMSELVNATIGRLDKVERDDHKGFDYRDLLKNIERYFDIVSIEGLPFRMLPLQLAFSVCIVARKKDGL